MMNGGDTAVEAWTALLDEMERELSFVTDQLATTGAIVDGRRFVPPGDLPPLPRVLEKRAVFLLERTRDVEGLVAQRAAEVKHRMAAVDQHEAERRPVRPAFFDRAI